MISMSAPGRHKLILERIYEMTNIKSQEQTIYRALAAQIQMGFLMTKLHFRLSWKSHNSMAPRIVLPSVPLKCLKGMESSK